MKKILKISAIILAPLAVIAAIAWFLYYATFQSNLWMKYPEPLKTQMALTHLEITDMENLICHEDCMYAKQDYRQIIADYLAKNGSNSTVAGQVKDKILDEHENAQARQDLVRALRMAEDEKVKNNANYQIKAPQYLIDYLSSAGGDQNLKDLIVSEFSADSGLAQGAVSALLVKIKNTSLGIDVRIPAIENLSSLISKDVPGTENSTTTGPIPLLAGVLDYPSICNTLMSVAEEKGDIRLRYAAVDNFYVCTNYKADYSEDIFNRLQNLLFNEQNHPEIEGSLVYNLSKYYIVDKEKTIEVMKKVYNDKNFNVFTVDTASDFLGANEISGFPEVKITREEDAAYTQHMDEVQYYANKPY